jgi:hypothetical protein
MWFQTNVINPLTSWLPTGLQPLAQLLIYFVILGSFAVIPLAAWLAVAVATTRRRMSGGGSRP